MPFDANGNFSLVPGTVVADGLNILPSQHNPPFQDVANGLSQVVVRDGRAPMTGPLNMNGYKITGVASGSQPTDVVTFADISDLGVAIGDGKWSLRDLSPNWLRRNGSIYDISDYPTLAAMLPPLPDGVTYTNRSIPSGTNVNKIVHADGKAVAVCNGGRIYVTEDRGVNWDQKTSGTSENLIDIAYGNGVWCAIAGNGTTCVSSDADTWTNGSVSGFTPTSILFALSLFMVAGSDGLNHPKLVTSADAVSWSADQIESTSGGTIWCLGTNGTLVIACAQSTIFRSTDGTSWSSATAGWTQVPNDVASDGTTFVIVTNTGGIWTTTTGLSATQRTSGTTNHLQGVDWSPDAGWIVVGNGGVARISTNAMTWTTSATGTTTALNTVSHDPSDAFHYLIGGASGFVLDGLRTRPTQFQVPNDGPNEWIRAL